MTETNPTILLADDERGLRDLFQFALGPLGYDVVTVADGQAAVEAIADREFDLVILDVHMPKLRGPDAFEQIRALRPEQNVMVVSSSSDLQRSFEERVSRELGVECLYKPMSLDELLAAIDRNMGRAK